LGSKYPKYLTLFLVSIALGIGVLLWYSFPAGYYNSFTVTYDEYDYPLIKSELQGKNCELAVSIGSRFPLFLGKEMLDGIDKRLQGPVQWHSGDGQKHESCSYLISKMKIGDLTLKNVVAYQSLDKDRGVLGKFLGKEFNLLLDFPHDRIIICDTFSKLQTRKLADKHWLRVPFEMNYGGIIFHVDTDFGMRKLAINTTSTFSLMHFSFVPSGQSFVPSPFSLGGQQFGNVTFRTIDLPEGLSGVDGFIGMNFLKKHALYLDYTHKVAYIEPPESYFERIPITFASRSHATINVSIEGNVYPLELDLGSSSPFSLRQEILKNLHKTSYGTDEWSDFRGQTYESPTYTIPEIKIGNLTFANKIVRQVREDFHINATLDGFTPHQPIGIIGLPVLEKYNLLLDFPHSIIYASNDYLPLQQAGILSQNLLAIPFVLRPDGILLTVETDVGTYRLVLDTGATHTLIRAPHPNSTTQFCIAGHDFGKRSIIPIDLSSRFEFDGCVGMDFFREYPLFIDYFNKLILLDLQKDKRSLDPV